VKYTLFLFSRRTCVADVSIARVGRVLRHNFRTS
jgi:hypothetical protein